MMKLSQFTDLLHEYSEKPFRLILPGEDTVPHSFHVTEVGHVTKTFIDCGGTVHTVQSCQLQAWVGPDADHRLYAGKMARVIDQAKAKNVLPVEDLDVEIEYEDVTISQYAIDSYAVSDRTVALKLASKHTDCLAKGVCLPNLPMAAGAVSAGSCGPSCNC